MTSTVCKREKQQASGHVPWQLGACLGCHQRFKFCSLRLPVTARRRVPQADGKTYSLESSKLVGFRHAGCSLGKTA